MRFRHAVAASFAAVFLPIGALAQSAHPVHPAIAPVDEYFGTSGESILEIRNRIVAVEAKSDTEARTTDAVAAIDFFEDALVDWQHKYPDDPWVADALSRTVRCYARAGVATNAHAVELYSILEKTYARSPAADRALLAVWEDPVAGVGAGVAAAGGGQRPLR